MGAQRCDQRLLRHILGRVGTGKGRAASQEASHGHLVELLN
jgi:hypothetical protein